jgi:hypothetical protein
VALGDGLLDLARLSIDASREDRQDLVAGEDRRLAKLGVEAHRKRELSRAGRALGQVLARAKLLLRRKFAV